MFLIESFLKELPGGNEFLSPIIEALAKNHKIVLAYKRFSLSESTERVVEPYGLKQSKQRWYLIAKIEGYDKPTIFSLDRIESLSLTEESFTHDKSINVNTYFDEVIGVNIDDDFDCEKVQLRVYGRQREYIDSLPLHKSQTIIARTKEYTDYQLTVRPEYEFQRAILALGPEAEILYPQWLREEIQWLGSEILKRYEQK